MRDATESASPLFRQHSVPVNQGRWGECGSFAFATVVRKLLQQTTGGPTVDPVDFRRLLVSLSDGYAGSDPCIIADRLNFARDVTGQPLRFKSECGRMVFQVKVACHVEFDFDALLALLDASDESGVAPGTAALARSAAADTWCVVNFRPSSSIVGIMHYVAGHSVLKSDAQSRVGTRNSNGQISPTYVSRDDYDRHIILVPVVSSCQHLDGAVPDQSSFVGSSVLSALLAAMKQHVSNAVLQEKGCWALANLPGTR